MLNSFFGQKSSKGGPMVPEPFAGSPLKHQDSPDRRPTYSKVFRWRLPDGQTQAPATVEIVGSFNNWQKVPLTRDSEVDAWHVTLHHIPGNRTHHYMILVDGKPVQDKNADGLAIPHGPQEEQFQLQTARGGRVFMLYAQTK
ncbi:MAG: glycogen-binding domain-containing protein [Verrucomicrobiota bacterium]